jgi:spore coat protein SA
MIYSVLPEREPFSAYSGGAISRDVANLMRIDPRRIVVCHSADDTWGFSPDRILVIPELYRYGGIKGRKFLPWLIHGPLLRYMFRPLISRLGAGDVVWCHSQPYFAAALRRPIILKRAKLICHYHNTLSCVGRRSIYRRFSADAVIFVSDFVSKDALSLVPTLSNTTVIYNGADETLFHPVSAGYVRVNPIPKILYVGRLNPVKGVHVLLEAMRLLQERKVNVLCKVVGAPFFGGSKVTDYAERLLKSRPSNVEFQGFRIQTEIAEEYRAADIYCCPSIWQEPFGNVNIEAMGCGIPVVATRVGGIPEIAAEGGIVLVEPNSAVEMADALQKLVEDGKLRADIGMKGLLSFQRNFTWTVINGQCQEVLNRMKTDVG